MKNIIMSRRHRDYKTRIEQLTYNLLALYGGRPYIEARLQRAPNESETSWLGSDTDKIPARTRRAFLINDAGRVASKIEQYLFSQPVVREGIGAEFMADATSTGISIGGFWRDVNNAYTAGQWAWLQVDRGAPLIDPETKMPRTRNLVQKQADGDRIFWSIWPSSDVVDWAFDQGGHLLWLICQDSLYDNSDPSQEAKEVPSRILWRRNEKGATWERYIEEKGEDKVIGSGAISIPEVPFTTVGIPAKTPWWFDDVEMIQCANLNLSSLHHENLTKTVYPQLVVPSSMVEGLETRLIEQIGQDKGRAIVEAVREIIRGMDRPFVETSEDSGLTRYLTPNASDLKAIPDEEDRRRRQLFDAAGLALFNRESRAAQTAESKQFDQLDTEATLKNRAQLMQEAENRMVAISTQLDPSFEEYTAIWPAAFNVPKTNEDVIALTTLTNSVELTPAMRRQVLTTAVKLLDQIESITPENRQIIMEEINELTEAQPEPSPFG